MKWNKKPWAVILPAAGDGSHLAATRGQDWTGILSFCHSPWSLPSRPACRFYFPVLHTALSCCHRQISDFLVCYCSTHWGKMSLLAGVWVPEQIDRKEKRCLHWDDKVERKIGRHMMEKLSLTQHLGKSHPFHLPIYTIPQLPSSLPPPPTHPPAPFISDHGRVCGCWQVVHSQG